MGKKKKIKLIVLLVVVVTIAGALMVCFPRASWFSEKSHIKRVSKLVEKRYMTKDSKYDYTDYTVYPLYDENDKLGYFLVEFEPYGFVYVKIHDKATIFNRMYTRHSAEGFKWQRYKIEEVSDSMIQDKDGQITYLYHYAEVPWEKNENGEFITYNDSHFKVADIQNEKRYLLEIRDNNGSYIGMIPAVKRGDKYLNLVSMEEFGLDLSAEELEYLPTANIYFPAGGLLDL